MSGHLLYGQGSGTHCSLTAVDQKLPPDYKQRRRMQVRSLTYQMLQACLSWRTFRSQVWGLLSQTRILMFPVCAEVSLQEITSGISSLILSPLPLLSHHQGNPLITRNLTMNPMN